jgi:hypothetical protein
MSILEKLPATYRFTEADVDRGMNIFVNYTNATPEEEELSDFALKAWDMYWRSKRWPTVIEVCEQFQSEELERQKKREQSYAKNN